MIRADIMSARGRGNERSLKSGMEEPKAVRIARDGDVIVTGCGQEQRDAGQMLKAYSVALLTMRSARSAATNAPPLWTSEEICCRDWRSSASAALEASGVTTDSREVQARRCCSVAMSAGTVHDGQLGDGLLSRRCCRSAIISQSWLY